MQLSKDTRTVKKLTFCHYPSCKQNSVLNRYIHACWLEGVQRPADDSASFVSIWISETTDALSFSLVIRDSDSHSLIIMFILRSDWFSQLLKLFWCLFEEIQNICQLLSTWQRIHLRRFIKRSIGGRSWPWKGPVFNQSINQFICS